MTPSRPRVVLDCNTVLPGFVTRVYPPMETKAPVVIDPEIQGGTPCIAGTRVPVRSLFDALKNGRTVDYFLTRFPTVTAEQVRVVLDRAGEMVAVAGRAA